MDFQKHQDKLEEKIKNWSRKAERKNVNVYGDFGVVGFIYEIDDIYFTQNYQHSLEGICTAEFS